MNNKTTQVQKEMKTSSLKISSSDFDHIPEVEILLDKIFESLDQVKKQQKSMNHSLNLKET